MGKVLLKSFLMSVLAGFLISCSESNAHNAKIESSLVLKESLKSTLATEKVEENNNVLKLEMDPSDYREWMKNPENNLLREKVMLEIKYQMILVPNDYLLLREFGNKIEASQLQQKEKSCNTQFVFRVSGKNKVLDLSKIGVNNQEEFNERIKYLSFDIQEDMYLESDSKEKIMCQVSTYERDYSLVPYATFTLQFPVCEKELSQYRLVYSDQLFNHGNIKFHWNQETINSIPKLIPINTN